jgi:hypothetical protein
MLWLGLNAESFTRFGLDALLYELEWRGSRLFALLDVMSENQWVWITGLGFGWGADQYFGLKSMTSGILGGDLAVAYGLGGVTGVLILLLFWRIILKVWGLGRQAYATSREKIAIGMYVLFVLLLSVFTPVLTQFVLSSGTIAWLLIAFLVLIERMDAERRMVADLVS